MGLLGTCNRGFLEAVTQLRVGVSLRLSNSHEQRPWGQELCPLGVAGQQGARSDFHHPGSAGPREHLPSTRSLLTLGA